MEDLLPYYEHVLTCLRRDSRMFAEAYPKIAGRLLMSSDVCEDPHIERLIESFALLSARVHKKLNDDFPEFTEALLNVLYPDYLRPFPSCSIARFNDENAATQLSAVFTIARGTLLSARPVKGISCKFKTVYPAQILPLVVKEACFGGILASPQGVQLPSEASACITLTLDLSPGQASFAELAVENLRFFLDGEPSLVSVIRENLLSNVIGCYVQTPVEKIRKPVLHDIIRPVGFNNDEALIDFDARSNPAYRLLTEYFAFPEKFNFIDIDLQPLLAAVPLESRQLSIHFIFRNVRADSNDSRLLERISPANFVLGCTPVVNLFHQMADPIRLTHQSVRYPVVADARRAHAFEVFSIDAVTRVQRTAQKETLDEFRPFYSLHHGESAKTEGRFWQLYRDDMTARQSPGYEYELSIVDIDFDPVSASTETLSIALTCTNRDLPSQLPNDIAGDDLFMESSAIAKKISFLRKPTPTYRFARGKGALWRLISHLSLNQLSLTGSGVQAFKEVLRLYDLPASSINQRQLQGVVAIENRSVTAWLPGNPFPTFVRGIEVRITIDETSFVGMGIRLFAEVMDRFLGMYVHANSFTQLVLLSQRTGMELMKCQPRSGHTPLA